jgi:hypothetical protein
MCYNPPSGGQVFVPDGTKLQAAGNSTPERLNSEVEAKPRRLKPNLGGYIPLVVFICYKDFVPGLRTDVTPLGL